MTTEKSPTPGPLVAEPIKVCGVAEAEAEAEQPEPEPRSHPDRRVWLPLVLAGCSYSVLSIVVWWNVWSNHPTTTTTCGCGDASLFTWFMEWPAYALAHGLNPLYSTAMFHPTGVNLLSNTSVLAVGLVLAPVTWLFGPVASLNLALTLAPVLSALAMFVLLRRWVSWTPAAFVGGLFYGFSPLVLVSLTNGYLMIGMAVVPPLVVACLDELLCRQRRPPVVTGVLLGVLVTLQFFIGTEALIIMAIGVVIGVALIVSFGVRAPRSLDGRLGHATVGLVAGGITAVVLLAYPTWFALAGPAHFSGQVWPGYKLGYYGSFIKDWVVPTTNSSSFVRLAHRIGGYQGPWLSGQYFGIGAAAVVLGGFIMWRRDRRLWLFGALTVISLVLALGARKGLFLPWQWFAGLPLLQNVIPGRFIVITYLAVSVMLGLIVDHVHDSIGTRITTPPATTPPAAAAPRSTKEHDAHRAPRAGWIVGVIVAAIALAPPGAYLAAIVPMTTQPVALPAWFRTVAPRLGEHQVLLVLPAAYAGIQSAMTWQAVDRMRFSMVGGGGPGGIPPRAGSERKGEAVIGTTTYSDSSIAADIEPDSISSVRRALGGLGVTMVVIPDQSRLPLYDRITSVPFAVALMTAATGQKPVHQADAWVWSGVNHDHSPPIGAAGLSRCASDAAALRAESVDDVVSCVLAGGTTAPIGAGSVG